MSFTAYLHQGRLQGRDLSTPGPAAKRPRTEAGGPGAFAGPCSAPNLGLSGCLGPNMGPNMGALGALASLVAGTGMGGMLGACGAAAPGAAG